MSTSHHETKSTVPADTATWLEVVRRQVSSLRYGVVQIVVHDSRVVQIERTEKVRFDASAESASPTGHPEAKTKSRGN